MRTQQWLAFLFSAALLVTGCRPGAPGGQVYLTVYAAASLTDAFQELQVEFERENPGVMVVYNFAGSNQLTQQLVQGAPADVFASANQLQMYLAADSGRIELETIHPFAGNRLVVVLPAGNPAGIESLSGLAQPGLKLVLAAPEVPAGQYSLSFLEKASQPGEMGQSYRQDVLDNVVSYEENVRAVLTKVILGEADAGIVYTTDAASAGTGLEQLDIPEDYNTSAIYSIAELSDSKQPGWARQFTGFVLSEQGQSILAKHGFGRVGP